MVQDTAYVELLQWALPRLGMRWPGFRKVRRQVCKRIARRLRDLGLVDTAAYRDYLESHPGEWSELDAMCRITISRFSRDRGVFDLFRTALLPELARHAVARGEPRVHAWSAGCASGEETYTLAILWRHDLQPRFPQLRLHVIATDAGAGMLERARRGCYPGGSLKELPEATIDRAFSRSGDEYCVRPPYRDGIEWREQDIRRATPDGSFDLVLCRYLVFTYFDVPLQRACLARIAGSLRPGGLLVLGKHESLPESNAFVFRDASCRVYQRSDRPPGPYWT